jgi:hypothetical protein
MTDRVPPEVEALPWFDPRDLPAVEWVSREAAERAVRDAEQRVACGQDIDLQIAEDRIRREAFRECVDALRAQGGRGIGPEDGAWWRAADFIERTLLGEGEA